MNTARLDWIRETGAAWDYRYQYLAAGVNTGEGWATWNSPPGAFVTNYMKASEDTGLISIFTYYMLTQSKPYPVDGKPDTNLNSPATMRAYYEDWKLLMQKTSASTKPVIVHVEPDLWGYMQQQHGMNPESSSVSVA